MLREDEQDHDFPSKFNLDVEEASATRTLTRRELARAVATACAAIPQNRAGVLVHEVLSEISAALVAGENVTLCNFGKFVLVEKKERKGRNPRTGDLAIVAPRRVASFRASRHMKAAIASNVGRRSD
ncbi:HU family DNA-binding protein [Methylocystis parvus]|uniref:Integration host factor subunit alpha n=1 Tax=Methylocystis parvus TaxID=134 RepID=A0A6B8LY17_9HYPH|nr:HU family DNA-binding protein [Methylocystis parvus]QGM97327.1 integration host factor subunit alpha [Methylocystis parvus]WBJ98762.1 HU family DNA-binding protein [Methylocystis parvus OBBP]